MPRYRLRASFWPTVGAVAGIALTVALGNWQLGRGQQKTALAEQVAAASHDAPIGLSGVEVNANDVVWHRVQARGRFEPKYAVLIDNRIFHGMAGYHVVMPLKIEGSERYVLVNRGWIAATATRASVPPIVTPEKTLDITGLATVPSRRFLELSSQTTEGNVWQNLTVERYRARFPISVQPIVVEQQNDVDDHLVREWSPPDLGADKHYAYAFQWFVMAAAILIIYLVLNVRKSA